MLTDADVELIKATRKEITAHRTEVVELLHSVKGAEDPYTGDPVITEVPQVVEATWRHWTSQSPGSNDISYVNGVLVESGDVMCEIPYEDADISDVYKIRHIATDKIFVVQAKDSIGLGAINRHYLLLRDET